MWRRCLLRVSCIVIVDYFYAKYTDWIEEFIHTFKNDKHLVLDGSKEKEAETCQNLLNNINMKINKLIETSGVEELNTTVNFDVLPSLFPTYIIGKNFKIEPL
jgi:GTP-dependent phosphoenolpyruvate carboxykinase